MTLYPYFQPNHSCFILKDFNFKFGWFYAGREWFYFNPEKPNFDWEAFYFDWGSLRFDLERSCFNPGSPDFLLHRCYVEQEFSIPRKDRFNLKSKPSMPGIQPCHFKLKFFMPRLEPCHLKLKLSKFKIESCNLKFNSSMLRKECCSCKWVHPYPGANEWPSHVQNVINRSVGVTPKVIKPA